VLGSNDSRFNIRLEVRAEIYPTEDVRKVLQAINTIIPFDEERDDVEIVGNDVKTVIVRKEGHEALIKLRSSFRSNRILDTARSLLLSRSGRLRPLKFHKQAAYSGKVRLCDEDDISPLGVIILRIEYGGDPLILANWLSPQTEKGKIVKEASTHELLYGSHEGPS